MRTTDKRLDAIVERINRMTDSPPTSWTRDKDNKFTSNVGNYHINSAYGGVALYRMATEGGGASDVFRKGHMSKRQLDELMCAFIDGIELVKQGFELVKKKEDV